MTGQTRRAGPSGELNQCLPYAPPKGRAEGVMKDNRLPKKLFRYLFGFLPLLGVGLGSS